MHGAVHVYFLGGKRGKRAVFKLAVFESALTYKHAYVYIHTRAHACIRTYIHECWGCRNLGKRCTVARPASFALLLPCCVCVCVCVCVVCVFAWHLVSGLMRSLSCLFVSSHPALLLPRFRLSLARALSLWLSLSYSPPYLGGACVRVTRRRRWGVRLERMPTRFT